jgi:hypothetical protein
MARRMVITGARVVTGEVAAREGSRGNRRLELTGKANTAWEFGVS